ncbi:MAG TPA: RluA family pseudouridine synthase [Gaiellales bacterium]|nr:RluA family pseudouridine synthase [Gaiellales bacterium]
MHSLTVPDDAAGGRLDRFLASLEEVGSRAAAERLIETGEVTVDGRVRPKSHKLAAGQTVSFPAVEPVVSELVPQEMDIPVLYRDDQLLVVDKPAGLLVHPVPGYGGPTLVHGLLHEIGGEGLRPGIVHRLDRDTSGLLVVARDDRTLARLQPLLRRRRIHRSYAALVRGRPASRRGTIEAPIGRDRRDPTRVSLDSDVAKPAVTHFTIAELSPGRTLLDVELETGRTHQIRVHLAAIGCPVVGDRVYGHGPELGLERQFLHAARLQFPHPWSGEQIDVCSPLPPDLAAALELARGGAVRTESGFR